MRPLRPATQADADAAAATIAALRIARPRPQGRLAATLARIRLALTSAEGAQRHALRRRNRMTERSAQTTIGQIHD
jgi:hypothetical protein